GRPGPGARSDQGRRLRPSRPARRADSEGDRRPLATLRRRGRRPHRELRQPRRAPRADPSGPEPRHLRARRSPRRQVHHPGQARPLFDAGRPGPHAVTAAPRTEVRPQRVALTFSPTVNMPTKVLAPRLVLTTSPTVNMPTEVR